MYHGSDVSDPACPDLLYSHDGKTWSEWTKAATRTIKLKPGKTVYFQAGKNGNDGTWFNSKATYSCFDFKGRIVFSGNIMSLLTQSYKKDMSDFEVKESMKQLLGY